MIELAIDIIDIKIYGDIRQLDRKVKPDNNNWLSVSSIIKFMAK